MHQINQDFSLNKLEAINFSKKIEGFTGTD
jgi:hypothetical protein